MQVSGYTPCGQTTVVGQQNSRTEQGTLFSELMGKSRSNFTEFNTSGKCLTDRVSNGKEETSGVQGIDCESFSCGNSGLITLEKSAISLNYPPSEDCKGLDALTEDVAAHLKEAYDFFNMRPDFEEFEKLICELKRLDIISEKDAQDMLLGQPMSFDEEGQPTSWLNYWGKGETAESEKSSNTDNDLNSFIMKWLEEMSETGKVNFEELLKRGEGNSDLAGLYQTKMNICQKFSDILGKVLAE